MKIVPFPRRHDAQEDALVADLEAALRGESDGEAEAESWRELRADVRALTPPLSPELEHELRARIQARTAASPARRGRRLHPRAALARFNAWLASCPRARLLAASGISAIAAIVVLALVAPWGESNTRIASELFKNPVSVHAKLRPFAGSVVRGPVQQSAPLGESSGDASTASASSSSSAAPSTRVQQRGASLTLAPKSEAVQSVADEVAQLAARDGGFVQNSHVSLQHGVGGEANLQLSLPSARLSTALAELARLAPARAESQSLQDITDEYDADRTKLADAVAERQALLRALGRASTQGEVESLHARLGLAAAAITRARNEYQAISKRGSNSSVEVAVLGDAHAGSSESTLSNALHDAGDVLKVALAVAILALAVLVPLAILLVLLALGWRATRRRLRERVLS
jgi:hypothetical protein